ncbi:coagulation factor VIII [Caerostris extrusa]|uniref:Coagulation factor VIII n=1 Tax=Caerostris extrusa TaxID=172846 RepID=A0AAV4WEL4_CAEEX|nr:coagulation factor VIII [Caerostris extrusa]
MCDSDGQYFQYFHVTNDSKFAWVLSSICVPGAPGDGERNNLRLSNNSVVVFKSELYPVNARLDSDTAWAPKLDDSDPYIKVDLIVPTNITGVMTRGRNDANEWVKTYEIEFSDNGLEWESQETGFVVEHKGNTDNESPVTNLFPESIFSRFIRIKPTSSERKIGLRFEILGCFEEKVCMEPMGIESGLMPEGQISASSSKTEILSPEIIRLNSEIGWSASTVEVPQFLQVDFGEPRNLSAVVIQGSPEEPEWVTAFLVTHSNDEEEWQPVTNDKDEPVEFPEMLIMIHLSSAYSQRPLKLNTSESSRPTGKSGLA